MESVRHKHKEDPAQVGRWELTGPGHLCPQTAWGQPDTQAVGTCWCRPGYGTVGWQCKDSHCVACQQCIQPMAYFPSVASHIPGPLRARPPACGPASEKQKSLFWSHTDTHRDTLTPTTQQSVTVMQLYAHPAHRATPEGSMVSPLDTGVGDQIHPPASGCPMPQHRQTSHLTHLH